jgi:hypothetical protein
VRWIVVVLMSFVCATPRAPAGRPVAAERVCTRGGDVVFENDCGCNDAIVCTATSVDGVILHVSLRTDPSRMPMCDDCFPMVPGACTLQPGVNAVSIDGGAAIPLPAAGHCTKLTP